MCVVTFTFIEKTRKIQREILNNRFDQKIEIEHASLMSWLNSFLVLWHQYNSKMISQAYSELLCLDQIIEVSLKLWM